MLPPKRKPFPNDKSLEFGSTLTKTSHGVAPALVFIITAPDVRFPYSTEGIPRTTSIDSILSGEIWRKSTPRPDVVWSFIVFVCTDELLPERAVENTCIFASFDNGEPSTTTAVPSELFEFSPASISRIEACPAFVRSGFLVTAPGKSCSMSSTLLACKCCIADCPISDDEPILPSLAVTTTSFKARLDGDRRIVMSDMLFFISNSPLAVSKPRYATSYWYFPEGSFGKQNLPSLSVTAQSNVFNLTVANSTGSRSSAETIRPSRL